LCSDLNFSVEDRAENIRRVGEVAKLFLEAGKIVIAAFISPINNDREWVRSIVPQGDFFEIYCECSVEECERRDVKGLYKLARVGKIKNFTGISSPYEPPLNPDLVINTGILSLEDSLKKIIDFLIEKKKIKNDESWD
jgi:adenylylsulfate kinase